MAKQMTVVVIYSERGNDVLSRTITPSKFFGLPSEKVSSLKGKTLLP